MKKLLAFLTLMIIAICPQSVNSEDAGTFSVSYLPGLYVFDNEQNIGRDIIHGIGMEYAISEKLSSELMINLGRFDHGYYDPERQEGMDLELDGYIGHLSCLYHFFTDKRVVPYLAVGFGGSVLDQERLEDESVFQVNYGGGVQIKLSDRLSVRGDVRHLYDFEESNNNMSASLGLTVGIARKRPRASEYFPEEEKESPSMESDSPATEDDVPKPLEADIPMEEESAPPVETAETRPPARVEPSVLPEDVPASLEASESVPTREPEPKSLEAIESKSTGRTKPDSTDEPDGVKAEPLMVEDEDGKSTKNGARKKEIVLDRQKVGGYRVLRRLSLNESTLLVGANGPIEGAFSFFLDSPDRLVVDIPGKWKNPGETIRHLENKTVRRVRVGEHPDKLRIVLDLKKRLIEAPDLLSRVDGVDVAF